MPRRFFLAILLLATLAAGPRPPEHPTERVTVTIIATTDLHGYILPFDYYGNKAANRGLAKAATIIRQLRKESPHALLIDCGDTIEGSPLVNVHAKQVRDKDPRAGPHPMMLAMNELDYDAMVVGNHEFNFGLETLLRARKDAQFPWLAGNVVVATTAEEAIAIRNKDIGSAYKSVEARVLLPMMVEDVDGVSVAIIGITTPAVPSFERAENIESYRFEPAVESVREWVKHSKEVRQADLVIVAAHSGLERGLDDPTPSPSQLPGENAIYEIAQKVPGVDGIIFGHTHQELAGKSVNGVILAQPKNWGQSVARMRITVERASDTAPWKVVAKTSEVFPVTNLTETDPDILRIAEPYHLAAEKYLDAPVAQAKSAIETRLGRVSDTAAIAAIHEVQLAESKADVSLASIFDTTVRIPAGPVTVRQLAALYPYENSLLVVEITGQILKDTLEHSAQYFLTYPGQAGSLINPQVIGFNYDAAAGAGGSLSYKIDLSKPVGQRINELRWKGAPLDPAQKLRLAVNSYRKAGGGGYHMLRDAKVVWQSPGDIRQMMIAYYGERKTIDAKAANNWEIVPEEARKALLAKPE